MNTAEMPVVTLTGSPRERGRIYGEDQRDRIAGIMERWFADIEAAHGIGHRAYVDEFLAATGFVPAIDRWTPGQMDEIRGMAEGAGVDESLMLAFNCMDEEWWFGQARLARHGAGGDEGKNCSAMGIAGQTGRPTMIAQTMDIAGWSEGYQVLLRHVDDETGLESLMFSVAGMLMLTGMNSAGVGVCCNTLLQLNHRTDGLPVQFVTRGILAQSSFEAAVAFAEACPHASGQNYTIGGPDRVASLECSANRVAAWVPGADRNRVWHTNHPFANDDLAPASAPAADDGGVMTETSTTARYACLSERFGAAEGPVTADDLKQVLAARDHPGHPVSREHDPRNPNQIGYTAGSMVWVLDPADAHVELAAGPASVTGFMTFRTGARRAAAAE